MELLDDRSRMEIIDELLQFQIKDLDLLPEKISGINISLNYNSNSVYGNNSDSTYGYRSSSAYSYINIAVNGLAFSYHRSI